MSQTPTEQPLPGGYINHVVRVGDTVRRPTSKRANFMRSLLRHLERHQWPGAPRFLGIDERGRDILTFIDGQVPWQAGRRPPPIRSEAALVQVARLVRQLHDLTAGTELAGDADVVCHLTWLKITDLGVGVGR